MRNLQQGMRIASGLVFLIALTLSSVWAVDYQPPVIGSEFSGTETYSAEFNIEGGTANGDLTITADTTYTVIRTEQYTQACPDLAGATYDTYYIEWTGRANLSGTVSINYPPINVADRPIRIRGATFTGQIWMRASDLATVAKKRMLTGNAELDLFGFGQWAQIATADLNQFEEYILPLEEYRWPLNVGAPAYEQKPSICAFGDYAANVDFFGLYRDTLSGDFSDVIDINFSVTVPEQKMKTVNGTPHQVLEVRETSSDFGASQIFQYSPDLRFQVRQEITQLSLFGLATIRTAVIDFTSANVPIPPTSTPTPTQPGDTPTPTPTPTTPGDTPTPTATTPGDTPTPTSPPSNKAPDINVAGYLTTYLSAKDGGNLSIFAWVSDPDGDAINSLELYVGGAGTGAMIPQVAPGIFQLDVPGVGAAPATQIVLEMKAMDARGAASTLWPYLPLDQTVVAAPSYAQSLAPQQLTWSTERMISLIEQARLLQTGKGRQLDRNASAAGPFVLAGGYFGTHLKANKAGDVVFGVIPTAGAGASITRVALYYGGVDTGAELPNGGTPYGPGVYGLAFSVPDDALAISGIQLEAKAFDSNGGESNIWPYFSIN